MPIPDIYLEVIEPALREVGHRWAMGALNVAEEHYATAVAQSILDGLSPPLHARAEGRAPRDRHRHARRAARARHPDGRRLPRGRRLGGPAARRRRARARHRELVESEQPELVALSTATAGVLHGVVEVFGALAALHPRPCIVAGGQFWTAETSPSALEFGADLVDPRPARARRDAASSASPRWELPE